MQAGKFCFPVAGTATGPVLCLLPGLALAQHPVCWTVFLSFYGNGVETEKSLG